MSAIAGRVSKLEQVVGKYDAPHDWTLEQVLRMAYTPGPNGELGPGECPEQVGPPAGELLKLGEPTLLELVALAATP